MESATEASILLLPIEADCAIELAVDDVRCGLGTVQRLLKQVPRLFTSP